MKNTNMIIWYGVAIFLWAIAYVLIAKAVGISSIINNTCSSFRDDNIKS